MVERYSSKEKSFFPCIAIAKDRPASVSHPHIRVCYSKILFWKLGVVTYFMYGALVSHSNNLGYFRLLPAKLSQNHFAGKPA
eukprot:scaffold478073_cov19-Prasinocladus_malaysianus.AAC.1